MNKDITPCFNLAHQQIRILSAMLALFPLPGMLTLVGNAIFNSIFLSLLLAFSSIAVLSLLAAQLIKLSYAHTKYHITKEGICYSRDFIGLTIRDIKFKNVKEITLKQGILQRHFGLGSVLLQTHATPHHPSASSTGLIIKDIGNSEELYKMIKKRIDDLNPQ